MELWASHVLAQGVGTSDVVRDMWKLSGVYSAQPSSPPGRKERVEILYSDKQTQGLRAWTRPCVLWLQMLYMFVTILWFGRREM